MIRINEAIAVEGRYDKNTLSQVVDTLIIEVGGFGIFTDKAKVGLLRRVAEVRGLIILTDSDASGLKIRNYLKGAIAPELLKQAYIPDIEGREKRKSSPSKEGKLGVEGMRPAILLRALERAGATFRDTEAAPEAVSRAAAISKADFYSAGLSGSRDSAARRRALLRELELPENLSANALLELLNFFMGRDEFFEEARFLTHDGVLDADSADGGKQEQG